MDVTYTYMHIVKVCVLIIWHVACLQLSARISAYPVQCRIRVHSCFWGVWLVCVHWQEGGCGVRVSSFTLLWCCVCSFHSRLYGPSVVPWFLIWWCVSDLCVADVCVFCPYRWQTDYTGAQLLLLSTLAVAFEWVCACAWMSLKRTTDCMMCLKCFSGTSQTGFTCIRKCLSALSFRHWASFIKRSHAKILF